MSQYYTVLTADSRHIFCDIGAFEGFQFNMIGPSGRGQIPLDGVSATGDGFTLGMVVG
jgi:hypothetical protein